MIFLARLSCEIHNASVGLDDSRAKILNVGGIFSEGNLDVPLHGPFLGEDLDAAVNPRRRRR
jgi:hypothetical protein